MSDQQQLDPKTVIAMIVTFKVCTFSEAAIRLAFGDTAAKSLVEVSQAFGVSYATVKHTWRPAGMPGNSKARHYPWADIVIWWLSRNTAADQARTASSVLDESERRELATINLATARADLKLRETKLARLVGEWVPIPIVRSVFNGLCSLVRAGIMGIPTEILPCLPAKQAHQIAADVERICRKTLHALADSDPEELVRRSYQENKHTTNGSHSYADSDAS